MTETFDVILIGAGSIGLPAAVMLSQAGLKVLVLDQFASPGQGSNKKAIGGIRATHSDKAKITLGNRSIELFAGWKDMTGDEIEWYRGGYSFVAYHEKDASSLQILVEEQQGLGLNIVWLDKKQLLEKVPDLNSVNLLGGTFSPDDGSASPLLMAASCYKKAIKHGCVFHFRENVTGLIIKSSKIEGVVTSTDEYHAPIVINAAGAWAGSVAEMAGINIPVVPDSHEAAITEPVARFFDPMIVDIHPDEYSSNCYFYQHWTGQIFFCITPSPNIWGFNTCETSQFLPQASRRIIQLMPRLKNIRVRRTWRGLYPMTPDGSPILGTSRECSGFIQAAGMCGQGFMLGPAMGEMITRMVLDELTPLDHEILDILSPYREFSGHEKLK
ncbi:MAG TPA: FAD-binding oxidoreductase [Anaerolineaceae bacterium]|nr:FAD-binding oxidoreductase [Anaerolineaceae bacterium]